MSHNVQDLKKIQHISYTVCYCSLIWASFRFTWQPPNHPVTAAIMNQCCGRRHASYWWLLKWKYRNFPLFSAVLHRIKCRIHTVVLTFAHIIWACCGILDTSSSHWLLWYPSAPCSQVETKFFVLFFFPPWKKNKGHRGTSLETADKKEHGSGRTSSLDLVHL